MGQFVRGFVDEGAQRRVHWCRRVRGKYADSERGCADVGQYKCGLVGESAQTWGERVVGCGGFAW